MRGIYEPRTNTSICGTLGRKLKTAPGNLGTRNVKVFSLVYFYFEAGKVCKSHARHPTLIGREIFFPLTQQRSKNSSFSKCKCINQSYNNVFERFWLLSARLEHQYDSVRVVPVIGQYSRTVKGTVNTSCPCNWTECVMCVRCCLAFRRFNCCFFYENVQPMSSFFLKFCHSFD